MGDITRSIPRYPGDPKFDSPKPISAAIRGLLFGYVLDQAPPPLMTNRGVTPKSLRMFSIPRERRNFWVIAGTSLFRSSSPNSTSKPSVPVPSIGAVQKGPGGDSRSGSMCV